MVHDVRDLYSEPKKPGNLELGNMEILCMRIIPPAENSSAVTLVSQALCLFGHEVGNHVGCGGERGCDIAQFDTLATEVDAHVDVA
jgi:hypothetical protein